jgi:hypothetical protein
MTSLFWGSADTSLSQLLEYELAVISRHVLDFLCP